MKPISFALIGKEVLFAKLDLEIVGYGAVIVTAGSCVSSQIEFISPNRLVPSRYSFIS